MIRTSFNSKGNDSSPFRLIAAKYTVVLDKCRNLIQWLLNSQFKFMHMFIKNKATYGLCGAYGESTIHLMKECHYAKCAWMSSQVGPLLRNTHPSSYMIWINEIADLIPKASFEVFLVVCWALWGAGNKKLWDEKLESPEVCTASAIQWWLEFTRTTNTSEEQNSRLRST
ncbi:hypothetical protein ACFX1Q_039301 [Malus domestica]